MIPLAFGADFASADAGNNPGNANASGYYQSQYSNTGNNPGNPNATGYNNYQPHQLDPRCVAVGVDVCHHFKEEPAEEEQPPQAQKAKNNNGTGSSQARAQAEAAVARCEGAKDTMMSSCSSSRVEQAASSLNNDVSGGASTACGQSGGSTGSASGEMSSIRTECSGAFNSCTSACGSMPSLGAYPDLQARASSARSQCATGSGRLAAMDGAIGRANQERSTAQECKRDATNSGDLGNASNAAEGEPERDPSKITQTEAPPFPGASNPGSKAETTDSEAGTWETNAGAGGRIDGLAPIASEVSDEAWRDGNPATGSPAQGSGGGLSDMKSANKAEGRGASAKKTLDANILSGRFGAGGAAQARGPGAGSYNQNGSWIPPKLGEKAEGLPNMDRFRPNLEGLRGPASAAALLLAGPILGPGINIWLHMNQKYLTVMPTLSP